MHIILKQILNFFFFFQDLAQSRFELIQLSRVKGPVTPSNLLTPPWSGKKYPLTAEDCKPSCSYK